MAPLLSENCRALVGWALTVIFVLLTGVIFRAGTLDAAWHVFQGLAIPPDLDRGRHLLPILIAPLVACLLPASQDIVAWLTAQAEALCWPDCSVSAMLALLIEIGDGTSMNSSISSSDAQWGRCLAACLAALGLGALLILVL